MSDPVTDVDKPMMGELRKQSAHIGVYRRRTVVLTPVAMQIYHLGESEKAISIIPITGDTTVSDIKTSTVRGQHGTAHPNQAIFQVIPNENLSVSSTSYRPRIFGSTTEVHFFAASSLELAEKWKAALENRAKSLANARSVPIVLGVESSESAIATTTTTGEPVKKLVTKFTTASESMISRDEKQRTMRARMKRTASQKIPTLPKQINASFNLIQKAQWREVLVTNGLRIMAEIALVKENPCLLISCRLPASPDRALRLYYDFERRSQWDNLTESVNLLNEDEDGHLRTMHCKLRGSKVGGLWMAPRDYIVDSSWRKDDDGSIVIIEVSNKDRKVLPTPDYVRAEIYSLGITLCPRRGSKGAIRRSETARRSFAPSIDDEGTAPPQEEDFSPDVQDSLFQMAVHANVGGWLAKMPLEWGQHWLYNFMLRVVGFKEILEKDNYESVDFNQIASQETASTTPVNKGAGMFTPMASLVELKQPSKDDKCDEPQKPPEPVVLPKVEGTLPMDHVYNIEEPFNVRSRTYLDDKKKEQSQGTMFQLIAMDLWEVDGPIENVAANMKGGLADKYLNTPGPKPYLFIVQFQVPGPPFLSFVAYFAAKPGAIENVSSFSRLFADFIEGTDAFRDSRFKFIPRVVKGSYVVKSAVGQTPAILGNKLVCTYHKGDGYFEIDVDVGSSNVAGGVLKIVKGYITALTIDMAFLLEAQAVEELPEVILGSLRFERLSLDMAKKWVPPS